MGARWVVGLPLGFARLRCVRESAVVVLPANSCRLDELTCLGDELSTIDKDIAYRLS
jgi:hypothetical protein